jgi:hypothetical protein
LRAYNTNYSSPTFIQTPTKTDYTVHLNYFDKVYSVPQINTTHMRTWEIQTRAADNTPTASLKSYEGNEVA